MVLPYRLGISMRAGKNTECLFLALPGPMGLVRVSGGKLTFIERSEREGLTQS